MFRGLFNTPMLMISDPQVLKQILTTQQYDFEKTPEGSVFIKRVLGEGLLVAEVSPCYIEQPLSPFVNNLSFLSFTIIYSRETSIVSSAKY